MTLLRQNKTMSGAHAGYLMILALVFGTIFLTVLGALASFTLVENSAQESAINQGKAFSLAEAGLEHYRWLLAHGIATFVNNTLSYSYSDPEGGAVGTITLNVASTLLCGQSNTVDINSTGTIAGTNISHTLHARYARSTVAQYSYVLNSSVWAGSDRVINGPYHSNGGIRMDGLANAPVTSSVSRWNCTSSFGCSTASSSANGVLGTTTNSNLWSYPTPQVDFQAIQSDFASLKSTAVASGLYFARVSSTNNKTSAAYWKGYHVIFNSDGTFTVKKVTATTALTPLAFINAADEADGIQDRMLIQAETTVGTYSVPSTCGLIYLDDNAWVEGVVKGKVTVVVASTDSSISPSAYLRGNITYANSSASDGLTLVAERNILITPDSPTNMNLNGIFIAQGGAFGRNYYGCPTTYEPRGTLNIVGTTVSNYRTGTKWTGASGCANSTAGYQTRIDSYDQQLANNPPSFTPITSSDYHFVQWWDDL